MYRTLLLSLLSLLFFSIDTASSYNFPYGRCYVNSCLASPYHLQMVTNNDGMVCFNIASKDCVDTSRYECCEKLYNTLEKFVIKTHPRCSRSVRLVTVNGVRKSGGVFFDLYNNNTNAELRITALRRNFTSGVNNIICVHLTGECTTSNEFCDSDTECTYALFDPFLHACCPTCESEIPSAMIMPPPATAAINIPPSLPTPPVETPPPPTQSPPPPKRPPPPTTRKPPLPPPQTTECPPPPSQVVMRNCICTCS